MWSEIRNLNTKHSDKCFCWSPAAMLLPIWMGIRMASPCKLYKRVETFLRISRLTEKNCCDLNVGESLWIFTFFLFPDSGLYLLNFFDFYFDMAWHWKPAIVQYNVKSFSSLRSWRYCKTLFRARLQYRQLRRLTFFMSDYNWLSSTNLLLRT